MVGRSRERSLTLLALLALVVGWQAFRFLCDDAYIDFRYVANARAGFGLVWNLPPFQPVEGYTSLLWVGVLWFAWALTGLDPTQTAEWLGLGFSAATVVLVARWASASLGRPGLVALVLLGTLTNRTFLAWTSSGLETSLWVLLLVGWTRSAWTEGRGVGVWAGLLALTRPDGLLFCVATLLLQLRRRDLAGAATRKSCTRPSGERFALGRCATRGSLRGAGAPLGPSALTPTAASRQCSQLNGRGPGLTDASTTLLPLLVVPVHLLWRHATYGFWVPNTAYAKVAHPWPEAGWRYAAAFVLEYGWWFGAALAGVLLLRGPRPRPGVGALVTIGALAAHVGWYTFWVGGDHFEFRIYAHLVPLAWLALAALVAGRSWGRAALLAQLAVSLPIPWTHYAATRGMGLDTPVHALVVPVAPLLPAPLAGPARAWDALEAWLIPRYIGVRHQEHLAYTVQVRRVLVAPHASTPTLDPRDVPVFAAVSVGVAGWYLLDAAVLDAAGLVDVVVAHNPTLRAEARMAHQRQPPPGYRECLSPDLDARPGGVVRLPRERPLTAADVRACEARFWAAAGLELPEP